MKLHPLLIFLLYVYFFSINHIAPETPVAYTNNAASLHVQTLHTNCVQKWQ